MTRPYVPLAQGRDRPNKDAIAGNAICPAPARRVTIYGGPWLFGRNDQVWHPSRGVFPLVAGPLVLQLVCRPISTRVGSCVRAEDRHDARPASVQSGTVSPRSSSEGALALTRTARERIPAIPFRTNSFTGSKRRVLKGGLIESASRRKILSDRFDRQAQSALSEGSPNSYIVLPGMTFVLAGDQMARFQKSLHRTSISRSSSGRSSA